MYSRRKTRLKVSKYQIKIPQMRVIQWFFRSSFFCILIFCKMPVRFFLKAVINRRVSICLWSPGGVMKYQSVSTSSAESKTPKGTHKDTNKHAHTITNTHIHTHKRAHTNTHTHTKQTKHCVVEDRVAGCAGIQHLFPRTAKPNWNQFSLSLIRRCNGKNNCPITWTRINGSHLLFMQTFNCPKRVHYGFSLLTLMWTAIGFFPSQNSPVWSFSVL